ncbi:MAG: efflux RND transporter periplasmic adaptor subunit [Parahaliea sp.]
MKSLINPPRLPLCGLLSACLLSCLPAIAEEPRGVPVGVADIQQMTIFRQVALTGTVTAAKAARLSAATSGLVEALRVDAGSRVAAGDVLLELDAELAGLQVAGAQAQARQAENALDDARRRLREARELVPRHSIAETVVRDLEAEVMLDEAALQQRLAEASYQRAVLARHTLRAPFTGVVSEKLTEVGEWVTPGQAVLALVATDAVRLDFPVAEDFLPALQAGGKLNYTLNARPDERYSGAVDTVVPVTDPGARTFLLRVLPGADSPALQPGMSVRAMLQIPSGRDGLVVPRDALLRYPDGRVVVWTVGRRDGVLEAMENPVLTGMQFDGLVEVVDGLEPGVRVVVEGNEALQDGQPVQIVQSRSPQAAGR